MTEDIIRNLALAGRKGVLENDWIAVIGKDGKWLGLVPDVQRARRQLRADSFEMCGSVVTKQYR